MKTNRTATFVFIAAMVMYAVKRIQGKRYRPKAPLTARPPWKLMKKYTPIQNAPYDVNATAPNVFFRTNSHMPAANWATPP